MKVRIYIETEILTGLKPNTAAEHADIVAALDAALDLLHNKFGRKQDYQHFSVRSIHYQGEDGFFRSMPIKEVKGAGRQDLYA